MKYNIDHLKFYAKENTGVFATAIDMGERGWVTAKPAPAPFVQRLKWSWKVLTGEYGVITWSDQT